MDYIKHFFAI